MGKINVYDKIVMKKEKRENMEIEKKIMHKSPSIRRFWMEFTACYNAS